MPTKTREQLEDELRQKKCVEGITKLVSDTDKENREWTCDNFADKPMFILVKNCVFILIGTLCLGLISAIIASVIK